jgi:hypothetical protein
MPKIASNGHVSYESDAQPAPAPVTGEHGRLSGPERSGWLAEQAHARAAAEKTAEQVAAGAEHPDAPSLAAHVDQAAAAAERPRPPVPPRPPRRTPPPAVPRE